VCHGCKQACRSLDYRTPGEHPFVQGYAGYVFDAFDAQKRPEDGVLWDLIARDLAVAEVCGCRGKVQIW
jgi:hypothetical protein